MFPSSVFLSAYLVKPASNCCVGWSGGNHSLHTMYLHDESLLLPGFVSPLTVFQRLKLFLLEKIMQGSASAENSEKLLLPSLNHFLEMMFTPLLKSS